MRAAFEPAGWVGENGKGVGWKPAPFLFEPREVYASLPSFAFDKNRRFAKLAPPTFLPEFIDIGLDVGERNNIVFIFDAGVIFKDEVVVDNSG